MNNYLRPEPERSYTFNGHMPDGAGEMYAMDHYVDPDFSGNVPEEIVRSGGTWDEENLILRSNGGEFRFV